MAMPLWDEISAEEFQRYLARYPACIAAVSDMKGVKDGQSSLLQLDRYRYGEVLDVFGSGKSDGKMDLDDVKRLVEWKLRHGTFRPALMKLVSSNDRQATQATIQQALALYRPSQDAAAALDGLTTLKGIGPATASLLLAVHDPDSVVFFADEAFYWLCGGGAKAPVRYTAREYEGLQGRCRALGARLGVRAVDVEKVAFVLMRDSAGRLGGSGTGTAAKTEGPMQKKDGQPDEKQQAYKRKKVRDEEQIVAGDAPRRSKRGKKDG